MLSFPPFAKPYWGKGVGDTPPNPKFWSPKDQGDNSALQGFPNWRSMSGILFQLLARVEQNSKIPTASLLASTTPAADKGKHNLNPPSVYICNMELQEYISENLGSLFNCDFFASAPKSDRPQN